MDFEKISSLQNPRLKNLVRLREANHRRRQNAFLIEGKRMVQRALEKNWKLDSLYFCEECFPEENDFDLLDQVDPETAVFQLTPQSFEKAAYRRKPDGWLAVGRQKTPSIDHIPIRENGLYIILEGIEKPGNLGAVLRTANALGAAGVLVADPAVDLFNPNVIRSSQGAFFDVPSTVESSETIQQFLEVHRLSPFVTVPDEGKAPWEIEYPLPVALVFGAEDTGLSESWRGAGYPEISLPMKGVTDSLNLSVTVGMLSYEVIRQQRLAGSGPAGT